MKLPQSEALTDQSARLAARMDFESGLKALNVDLGGTTDIPATRVVEAQSASASALPLR